MPLLDFQASLGGITMGDGTVYVITNITGLGLGPKRTRAYEIPGGDGVEWGREHRNGKTITIEGEIATDTSAEAWAAALALEAAWDGAARTTPRTSQELRLKVPGQAERVILGRPNLFDYDPAKAGVGYIIWSATFDAAGA